MNESNVITIKNLVDCGLNEYVNYKNQIVISYIKDLSLFRIPCHLKATTILVCISGELECSVNLKTYRLGQYSVLINFPENIIQLKSVKDLKAFAIILSSEFIHSLSLDMLSFSHYHSYEVNKNETFILPRHEVKHLSHYLSIIRDSITSPITSVNEDLMKHIAASFLTNIMLLHHHYHINHMKELSVSKGTFLILDKFIELVGLYHSQERELRFYADKMCITPKYLSNTVKKVSGKKATDWISDFVILEAKSLLRYSGKNIQEVSNKLNFPTQSAFGKYFKSQVGISPSEFIENNQTF